MWSDSNGLSGGNVLDLFRKQDYRGPPAFREFMSQHGGKVITKITVCRRPLPSAITTVGNAISKGALSKAVSDLGYDGIFHLWLNVTFDSGETFGIEKNHVLRAWSVPAGLPPTDTACRFVPLNGRSMTLSQLIRPAVQTLGPRFAAYSLRQDNCQAFVEAILKYSGLLTPELHTFIYQNASKIAESLPAFGRWLADKATGLAAKLDQVIHGTGRFGEDPRTYTPIRQPITEAGYRAIMRARQQA